MCMADDADLAYVWNESQQRARKPHTCGECGRTIAVGERYWRVWAVNSDGPFQGKWCDHCNVAKEWLWQNCHGSILGGVYEDIREHVQDYGRRAACIPRLARLVVGMDHDWRIQRGPRAGQLMPVPVAPCKLEPRHAH